MTKKDLAGLATKKDLAGFATKKDLQQLERRMEEKMEGKIGGLKVELKRHFEVVAENLVYDFKGIFKDRLEQHEDRIVRLEEHVGIARV